MPPFPGLPVIYNLCCLCQLFRCIHSTSLIRILRSHCSHNNAAGPVLPVNDLYRICQIVFLLCIVILQLRQAV